MPYTALKPSQELVDIVGSLGGVWHGYVASCRCPAHSDKTPSLSLRQGDRGILVTCFAGCDAENVLRELRRMPVTRRFEPPNADLRRGTGNIVRLWDQAIPVGGTLGDANGRPLSFFMTAGQVSDYTGAAALLDDMPKAQWLLGDRGYDADWFRDALQAKGIQPCIPGRRSRNEPIRYDKRRYRRRSRIEIMFGRLKDWRRVATRYDRCPTAFFSAIALAATVIFWL